MREDETRVEGALALAAGGGGRGGMPPDHKLDRSKLNRIGAGLRAMYGDTIREPIPGHLLAQLSQDAKPEQEL